MSTKAYKHNDDLARVLMIRNTDTLESALLYLNQYVESKLKEQRENIFKKATKDMAVLANYSLPEADLDMLYNDFERVLNNL